MATTATIVVVTSDPDVLSGAVFDTHEISTHSSIDIEVVGEEVHVNLKLAGVSSDMLDSFIAYAIRQAHYLHKNTVNIFVPYNWSEFFKEAIIDITNIHSIGLFTGETRLNHV